MAANTHPVVATPRYVVERVQPVADTTITTGDRSPTLIGINGIRISPVMVPYVQALRDFARRLGASFKLASGYRTPAEQAALRRRWEAGDPSVIYPPAEHSYHEYGLAVDLESDHLAQLGAYAERLGMRWGGRFGDPVHFDLGRTAL